MYITLFFALTLPQTSLDFTSLKYNSFEITVGKEEIAPNEQFLLSHSVFYPFGDLLAVFIESLNCCVKTLSFWKSLNSVVWERVNVFKTVHSSWIV